MLSRFLSGALIPSLGLFWNIFTLCSVLLVTLIYARSRWKWPHQTIKHDRPVFRVTGLPASSDDDLNDLVNKAIKKLLGQEKEQETSIINEFLRKEKQNPTPTITILPSCSEEQERLALVEFSSKVPDFLSNPLGHWQVQVGDMDYSFDRHFFGFTQLYTPSPENPITADIIAITGLDGHAYGSWRGKGNLGRMWLRHFLAKDLPNCRTMIYGYNSKLSSHGIDTIMDYGREMLEELKKIRNTDELRRRPLFFIAHSFGGLVLAQCLVKAVQTNEADHPTTATLHRATYGMLLFGIPHKGLVVDNIQQMLAGDNSHPRGELLEQIRNKSDLLASQLVDFKNLIRDRKIVSFYEMQQTRQLEFDKENGRWERTGAFLTSVNKDSALLELPDSVEEKIPLQSDHSMMVKFDSRNEKGYTSARDKLKDFEKSAPRVVEARFAQSAQNTYNNVYYGSVTQHAAGSSCLSELFVTDPQDDRDALKRKKGEPAEGTCEWILGTDEIATWLGSPQTGSSETQASQVLWLHGNPGTGKSTMAIFLTEELPKAFSAKGGSTLAYFFCDSSFDTRKTATSVIRGLLYQLIKQHQQLLSYVLPEYNRRKVKLFESFDTLWSIFMAAAADQETGTKYCIIDALDECDEESQTMLLQQLKITYQNPDTPPNVRILLTSRPYAEIRERLKVFANRDLATFPNSEQDIDIFIEERMKRLRETKGYTATTASLVSDTLRDRAEGTFLWIGIACNGLEGIPSNKAVSYLMTLPKGLYSLYEKLLDTAFEQEMADAKKIQLILRFVAVSLRPLSLLELSEACQLHTDESDEETRLQYTREHIESCRLMVVIQDEEVLLLHKSVKDYLMKASEKASFCELEAHALLAYRCINHFVEKSSDRKHTTRASHFLDYAIREWPNHAHKAQSRFEVRASEEEFFKIDSPCRESWLAEYRHHGFSYRSNDPPQNFSVFHVAARWRIPALAEHVCRSYNLTGGLIQLADASGATPLEYAVSEKYAASEDPSVVRVLLDLGAIVTRDVTLAAARNSASGKEVIALLLEKRGYEVTITDEVVRAAAENWYGTEVLALLLELRGDEITITDEVVRAAVKNVVSGKEVMALLLEKRGDEITITEKVLKAAAKNVRSGKELITLLLEQRGDKITITENVLKAAAKNERCGKEIMALLLEKRGDEIIITDKVVNAAAKNERSGKEVMALLLKKQRGKITTITDKVVQAAAKNETAGNEVLALLLEQRGDEITITDEVVEAAAGNEESGKEIIALLLRERGDEITITEEVMKAAAENEESGKEIIALLLKERGDEITITDTVVQAAAGNWGIGDEIIALLLKQRGYEITAITDEVAKAAAKNSERGKKVLALLLQHINKPIGQ